MWSRIFLLPAFLAVVFAAGPVFAQSEQPDRCDSEVCYIEITGEGFVPDNLVVNAGATAVWRNADDKVHAVASYSPAGDLLFNSTFLKSGDVFEFTFTGHDLGFHEYFEASTGATGHIEVAPNLGNYSLERLPVDSANPASGVKGVTLIKGNVTAVGVLPELNSLTVDTQTESSDVLRLSIDRRLLDATEEGEDIEFQVLANERAVGYREIATASERMLSIPISKNVKTVQITGTQVSTEFLGYEGAKAAIDEADLVVSGYRKGGIVVSEADGMLMQAKDAFAGGKYPFSQGLAGEAIDVAHNAGRAAVRGGPRDGRGRVLHTGDQDFWHKRRRRRGDAAPDKGGLCVRGL
ncbi:hypothetical protein [Candidatus Nitrososphaera sp. FF02]|uniref:cupredoxin domain-containing protein n=1 Tax=Candidatus Nitrososphaera sp. FF02 TaxID=3398226 RepID=UPI0039EAF59A